MSILSAIQEFAPLLTAAGVLLASLQLWLRYQLAKTRFEDDLAKEYRLLIKEIPVDVLLGKAPRPEQHEMAREQIFNYFDLTNEQVFLRKRGRIRKTTWVEWAEGVECNLRCPLFKEVWAEIRACSPELFVEVRTLIERGYKSDPRTW